MKFCWVTINVKNMDASITFYTKIVGLPIDRRYKPNQNMQIAFLGSGETKVELIYDSAKEPGSFGNDISIGFEVESLDALMTLLQENGIPVESGPFQPNPTIRFIFVRDPNGVQVQFVEHCKAGRDDGQNAHN